MIEGRVYVPLERAPKLIMPLKPSRVREMSEGECGYVGALIDGEGTVYDHFYGGAARVYPHISLANTDPEIISALLRMTGTGSVSRGSSTGKLGTKPHFIWQVMRSLEFVDLAQQLYNYSIKIHNFADNHKALLSNLDSRRTDQ